MEPSIHDIADTLGSRTDRHGCAVQRADPMRAFTATSRHSPCWTAVNRPNRIALMSAVYAYCGSVVLLLVARRQLPDIPWVFLPFLLFVSLPIATAVTCALGRIQAENVVTKVAGAVSGLALVWWSGPHVLWPIAAIASAFWQWRGATRPIFLRIL